MTWRSPFLIVTTVLLLGTALHADKPAPDRITMQMSRYVAPARGEIVARIRVQPDAKNRELTIEWTAEDLSGGSHTVFLEGDRAAISHNYPIKQMAPGVYEVVAILRLNDGKEIRLKETVYVVGVGGPEMVGGGGASAASSLMPAN